MVDDDTGGGTSGAAGGGCDPEGEEGIAGELTVAPAVELRAAEGPVLPANRYDSFLSTASNLSKVHWRGFYNVQQSKSALAMHSSLAAHSMPCVIDCA